jgi:hypothetical protein
VKRPVVNTPLNSLVLAREVKGTVVFGGGGDGLDWRLASLAMVAAEGTVMQRHKASGGGGMQLAVAAPCFGQR